MDDDSRTIECRDSLGGRRTVTVGQVKGALRDLESLAARCRSGWNKHDLPFYERSITEHREILRSAAMPKRDVHHWTPEQFMAAGIALEAVPPCTPEWYARVDAGFPTRPPPHKVGDWVFNPISKVNAKVLTVWWDAPCGSTRYGWRVNVPGFGSFADDVSPALESAPFVEYVETSPGSNCWKPVTKETP